MNLKITNLNFLWILLLAMAGSTLHAHQKTAQKPAIKVLNSTYPGSIPLPQKRAIMYASQPSTMAIDIPANKIPAMIALRIVGPVGEYRVQAEGGPAAGDISGLVDRITEGRESDRERAEALFQFVVSDMKDWYFPAQGINLTVEDLGCLIWNFGFGFCYDLGRLTAGLWAEAGLRSRIVGWPNHTVAEVYYDHAWHLYDLQHRSFYEKSDGQVASFRELQANPDLFYQNLNEVGLDAIGYPPNHLAHWYQQGKPNFQDSKQGPHWKTEKSFKMNLRSGEYFEILYNGPVPIYHPTSWHQYYGEKTTKKDPPWPLQGRLTYAPKSVKQKAKWVPCKTPEGIAGLQITMASPYLFTRAWMKIPGISTFSRVWVQCNGQTYFVGRLVGGNVEFSKFVEGANEFNVMLDAEEVSGNTSNLEETEVHTRLQISHIGLPRLHPGKNQLPFFFNSGTPQISVWYLESVPDLEISGFQSIPEHPKQGQDTILRYRIQNNGSCRSSTTTLTVFNNVTALLAETTETVGIASIPPLDPGETTLVDLVWTASTRMTWYGQNPDVQLMDAWIDFEKHTPDPYRANNRAQDYIILSTPNGRLPKLPGYQPLP